jgi:excisionase family DNA binding protein
MNVFHILWYNDFVQRVVILIFNSLMRAAMPDAILSIEDIALKLRVHTKTVYRWISAGDLAAAKVGYKTYRVFESDLIRFLRDHMIAPNPN